jgi:alpha-glucosidase (family GH31 glycosyl hydrolase)
MQSYETGYPHTVTPLPIAYPDDAATYDLTSRKSKQYEWLLGPSLLAAPVFGSDYDTARSRDVYLPDGRWMDYETGEVFTGPTTLKDYPRALDAMPLFVGRTGIIVEQDDAGKLWAEIYPQVADGSAYTFVDRDSQRRSVITVDGPLGDAAVVKVQAASGAAVKTDATRDGRSVRFELRPGVDYRVGAGAER